MLLLDSKPANYINCITNEIHDISVDYAGIEYNTTFDLDSFDLLF